jgi:peptidyl-prolyl cis-trans isomerase D
MLAIFRRSLATWPVRVLFGVLVLAFGLWGVADVVRNIGRDSSVASVAGERIEMPELQQAYQQDLAQTTRMLGNTDPTPAMRRSIAVQAVSQLVTQKALAAAVGALGVAVPEAALVSAVQDVPQFRNPQGQYDADIARQVLRNNGLNERTFGDMLRGDLARKQVLDAVTAGITAPPEMARQVFEFQQEKRVADAVEVLLSAAPPAPAPTPLQIERWWANNPDKFSTPEYRRVKAIVLAPETLAKDITVTDEDLKGEWEQHKADFNKPERRSVQVILTQDEAEAQKLAAEWSSGSDWTVMQAEAAKTAAAPVELNDAVRTEFPAPELGDAVFATPVDTIPPPVHSALGWHVLKVVKITPGGAKTFDEARDALRQRVIADKAVDMMYDRANRIENLLSSGTSLDDLPGDLGVAAVTGTLDAQGDTPEGQPAPIPGPAELHPAFVQAAFAAKIGDQPKLTQAPNAADGAQSFFALAVEKISPPALKPLAEVDAQVRADWAADQQHRAQDAVAAKIYGSLRRGVSLADAAEKAGLPVHRLPATGRSAPADGFPQALLAPLFSLKKGEATMVETPDGFVVAVLAEIQEPDPKADPVGYSQVEQALAHAMQQDAENTYASAVRARAHPYVNQAAVENLAAPPSE